MFTWGEQTAGVEYTIASAAKKDLSKAGVVVDLTNKKTAVYLGDEAVPESEYDVKFYKYDGKDYVEFSTEYLREEGKFAVIIAANPDSEKYTGSRSSLEFSIFEIKTGDTLKVSLPETVDAGYGKRSATEPSDWDEWESSDTSVAVVTPNATDNNRSAVITAKAPGKAIIWGYYSSTLYFSETDTVGKPVSGYETWIIIVKDAAPAIPEYYTVSFDANGGSAVASQSVIKDGKATSPAAPARNGYTFVRWELGGTAFDSLQAISLSRKYGRQMLILLLPMYIT